MPRHASPTPIKYCLHCQKQLERKRFGDGRLEDLTVFKRRKFCNQVCMALNFNGRDKGGKSDHQSRSEAAKLIPMRPCRKCGKPGTHVHHIDENPQNNMISNLERLCPSCHKKLHWELSSRKSRQSSLKRAVSVFKSGKKRNTKKQKAELEKQKPNGTKPE